MGIKVTRRSYLKSTFFKTKRQIEEGAREAADMAADLARQFAPVSDNNKPGHVHMRDTIVVVHRVEGLKRGWSVLVQKPYAPHVEYGTVHTDAQPFIRPAVREAQELLRSRMKVVRGIAEIR